MVPIAMLDEPYDHDPHRSVRTKSWVATEMVKILAAALLLAAISDALGQQLYEGFALRSRGLLQYSKAESLDECYKSCVNTTGCSALTYHCQHRWCVRSFCGHNVLKKSNSSDYTSIILGNPVISGLILPDATHDYPFTDRCGSWSYGLSELAVGTVGLDYQMDVNPIMGKALHFPGTSDGLTNFARTFTNPSLQYLAPRTQSFTVVLNVNFKSLTNKQATLFEFRSDRNSAYSSIFWLSPNITTLYYNYIDRQYNYVAVNFQLNTTYHIAIAYNGQSFMQSVYINGNLWNQAYINGADRYATDFMTIGGRLGEKTSGLFDGNIYCFGIYASALGPHEIAEHRRSCVDGLVRIDLKP